MKHIGLVLIISHSLLHANIHYVSPSGGGSMNATSWANAAPGTQLQAVINAAAVGDSVWVACGTYYTTTGSDRTISFSMREGVSIFGSFAGTETLVSQRTFNTTGPCSILSGEIGSPGLSDNSYKVIYNQDLTNSAILDGFIIRDGNDERSPTSFGNGLGGGIYNHGFNPGGYCHPVIRNCVFTNNAAGFGGGAFNNGYNGGNAEPIYINCVFDDNHAYVEAGGMDSYGVGGNASPTLYNCIFYHNTSATNVGGMYCWGGNSGGNSNPVMINCMFLNNRAYTGYCGGFIASNIDENLTTSSGTANITLQNCILWGNDAPGEGQQFYIQGNGAEVLANYTAIDSVGHNGVHSISGSGTGNQFIYPGMVDTANPRGPDGHWLTYDDGLRLVLGSPAINMGNNIGTFPVDVVNNTRTMGLTTDIGPYESYYSSLEPVIDDNHFVLYPNPVYNETTIRYVLLKDEKISISILDVTGKIVVDIMHNSTQQAGEHHEVIQIDASMPAGIYYVKLLVGEKVSVRKFYKE